MSEYIFDVVSQTSKLDWAFAFQRTGAFPLDRSSLFSSYEDAVAYARGDKSDARELGGSSYVGQPVSVYDADSKTVNLYIIEADRTLKEVGSAPIGDNASIEIVDGRVQLKDFGVGYYAYVPAVKNEDGEVTEPSKYVYTEGFKEGLEARVRLEGEDYVIAWYEPSGETIEDINATLESVKSDIEALQEAVKDIPTELVKKANAADVYTKAETDKAIADEIAKVDHLKRTTVAGIESIDLDAEDADQYIYMVPNTETGSYDEYMVIDGELERVGDWGVDLDDYATKTDLEAKVDKVEGSRLMTEAEGEKLAGIAEGANKNVVESVAEGELKVENGQLSVVEIAQSKVKGLVAKLNEIIEALDGKVDTDENARLITNDEIAKLEAVKDLIQSVDTEKFTVDENGKLLLNSVEITEIEGLADALGNKVDKVEGSRLMTADEAAKLEKLVLDDGEISISGSINAANVKELYDVVTRIVTGKGTGIFDEVSRDLLGIEAGAQKNYIDSVDQSQLIVEDQKLKIKAIEMSVVSGLEAALNSKASAQSVTNLETLLNTKYQAHEARIAALEGQMTWQPLFDEENL
jgi:hypothetical protein